jgi:DNA repair protein RadC
MDENMLVPKDLPRRSSGNMVSISELPRGERPRERLASHGASRLSSIELLAIVLGAGTKSQSALTLAHHALARAGGSLRRMASEPIALLTDVPGIGRTKAAVIHASLELGRRMMQENRQEGLTVRSPHDIYRVFGPRLEDLPVEEFHVAVLDSQQRLQRDILVSRGTLNASLVHPREVFREAIAERAASLVLVHNHPSGDPSPSMDDRVITDQLLAAGELVGITVRDHVIVGRGRYVSFMESGLLASDRRPAW